MRCTATTARLTARSGSRWMLNCPVRPQLQRRAGVSVVQVQAKAAGASSLTKQQLEERVHKWFESLAAPDHPIEDMVAKEAKMFDNINQACYKGYAAMKHRMQSVHESLPNLVEVSDIADAAHNCVAAHWVAKSESGEVTGTYVFKFDAAGMIEEITAYQDSDEEEFLEA